MRELFKEYGLAALEIVGVILVIGMVFKVFWGNDSLIAPIISSWLDAWV